MTFILQNALPLSILVVSAGLLAYAHFGGKRIDRERAEERRRRHEARLRGRHVTTARSRRAREEKHAA